MTADSPSSPKPLPSKMDQRSLASEFEKLCSTTTNSKSNETSQNDESFESANPDASKTAAENKTSPNNVLDFDPDEDAGLPNFQIDFTLQGDLAQETLDRVAVYHVIQSVNMESEVMSTHDFSEFSTTLDGHKIVVDEERWLLSSLPHKPTAAPSPTSFLEAIGEKTRHRSDLNPNDSSHCTPNPLNVVMSSRTQLWKPSRSWWEAKSGKNPWIEPRFHAKRWRFLWPLIHYHKFLAKCIKKLKRFGVEYSDKNDLPTFLRAEVVAISKHLAHLSGFTSEDWTNTLPQFHSWSYPDSASIHFRISQLIQSLAVRPIGQQLDEESPILLQHYGGQSGLVSQSAKLQQQGLSKHPASTPRGRQRRSYNRQMAHPAPSRPMTGYDYAHPFPIGMYPLPPSLPPQSHHHHASHYSPYQPPPMQHMSYYHHPYNLYCGPSIDPSGVDCSVDESFDQGCWQHLDPMRSLASPPRYPAEHPGYKNTPLRSPPGHNNMHNNTPHHQYTLTSFGYSQQHNYEDHEPERHHHQNQEEYES